MSWLCVAPFLMSGPQLEKVVGEMKVSLDWSHWLRRAKALVLVSTLHHAKRPPAVKRVGPLLKAFTSTNHF